MEEKDEISKIHAVLTQSFIQCEQDWLTYISKEWKPQPINSSKKNKNALSLSKGLHSVGSCALVVIVYGTYVHVGHIGDCRAVISSYDSLHSIRALVSISKAKESVQSRIRKAL